MISNLKKLIDACTAAAENVDGIDREVVPVEVYDTYGTPYDIISVEFGRDDGPAPRAILITIS